MTIMYYYLNLSYNCKWGDKYSGYFDVPAGTKQGGILSPDFFGLYIDELVQTLKREGIGCHVIQVFVACILFADDATLLAPTRSALQRMIDICLKYCSENCFLLASPQNVPKSPIVRSLLSHRNSDNWPIPGTPELKPPPL